MRPQQRTSPIAHSYAEALLRTARNRAELARVREECAALAEVLRRTPRLTIFLGNPQVPEQNKSALMRDVFESRFGALMMRLIGLLIDRQRTPYLPEVLASLEDQVEQAEGIYQAQVQSAFVLDGPERARLQEALEKWTDCRLRIEYEVQPELIGGLIFRCRDLLIDESLRSGLMEIRRRLLDTTLMGN